MSDRVKSGRLDLLAQAGAATSLFRAGRRKDAFLAARDRRVASQLLGDDAMRIEDEDVGEFVLGDKTERHEHRAASSWPMAVGTTALGAGLGVLGSGVLGQTASAPGPVATPSVAIEQTPSAASRPATEPRYGITAGPPAGWRPPLSD